MTAHKDHKVRNEGLGGRKLEPVDQPVRSSRQQAFRHPALGGWDAPLAPELPPLELPSVLHTSMAEAVDHAPPDSQVRELGVSSAAVIVSLLLTLCALFAGGAFQPGAAH
jgi:hypothetical protein